ncbi:MAG: tRNA pseudouridine(38-40) synthase TruA [Desulfovibrionaceae bacterium]|nr:tRNA pseudouridine(38-40) synthase TruA [Desulfovibrionaceae bacterium]
MQRFKLTISYVGTRFCGWQRQTRRRNGIIQPELRTVQSELENLASRIAGQKVIIHASGRTDTGVHAEAQVAHMDVPKSKADINWIRAFNTQLPDDVAISAIEPVDSDFHAQYSARSKLYAYSLWMSYNYTPPRLRPFVWSCGPLNLELMQEAARCLLGRHDFASFRNTGVDYNSTVRTLTKAELAPPDPAQPLLATWHFEADGFLKQMVRNVMGLLAEVGRGKLPPEAAVEILAAKDRTRSPATAPACGLTLVRVDY